LIVLGDVALDRGAVGAVREYGVRITIADDGGRHLAFLSPDDLGEDVPAVRAQCAASQDSAWRLGIARRLIASKLRNYAALADADPGGRPSLPGVPPVAPDVDSGKALRDLADRALAASSLESLLGIEGAGAARWYGRLRTRIPPWCRFERRVAPDAEDPFNIMLNMAQTALYRQQIVAIRSAGLLPSLGLLHELRPGHAALASDLQEPFRHLMDRAAIHAVRTLQPKDFRRLASEGAYSTSLSPSALRHAQAVIHRSFALTCVAAGRTEGHSYLTHFSLQARSLKRHLLDRSKSFDVFEHPIAVANPGSA